MPKDIGVDREVKAMDALDKAYKLLDNVDEQWRANRPGFLYTEATAWATVAIAEATLASLGVEDG